MTDTVPIHHLGVDLRASSFRNADLSHTKFNDVSLRSASFVDVCMASATFVDVDLSMSLIENANLEGMTINGVLVTDLLQAYRSQGAVESNLLKFTGPS